MKLTFIGLTLISVLFASGNSIANNNNFGEDCTFADWQNINRALNLPAEEGEEYRATVKEMAEQEMGPVCKNVSKVGPGIPGNRYYTYVLYSAGDYYQLNIVVGGVEQPGTRLRIEKLEKNR